MIDRQRRSGRWAGWAAVAALVAIAASATARADAPPLASEPTPAAEPELDAEAAPAAQPPPAAAEPAFVAAPTPADPTAPAAITTAPTPTPASAVAIAAPRLKRETHGLALSVGLGIAYSALGVQARYDIPVRQSVTVSPFVAAGLFGALAGPVGVTTALGERHRLAVDLGVAPLIQQQLYLHGTWVDATLVYGPAAGVGYEHMSDGGWFQHMTLEYAYAAWGSAPPINAHIVFTAFGIGRRIW